MILVYQTFLYLHYEYQIKWLISKMVYQIKRGDKRTPNLLSFRHKSDVLLAPAPPSGSHSSPHPPAAEYIVA